MTRREELVAANKLEDMTYGAWVHMIKYEFINHGAMTPSEADKYVNNDESWRIAYDEGYEPYDIAVDEMSYWGD